MALSLLISNLAPTLDLAPDPAPAPVIASGAQSQSVAAPSGWVLDELRGRLVELLADGTGASMTLVFDVILQSQEAGEPVAWISATPTLFSSVDAELGGVDLSALIVVRVRNVFSAARSAERLLRSGAFGVVVLDLGPNPQVPTPLLGKLIKLAQLHDAAVLGVTASRRGRASLGSLVSLRVGSQRTRAGNGQFTCRLEVLKDKRRGPNWSAETLWCGPTGLR